MDLLCQLHPVRDICRDEFFVGVIVNKLQSVEMEERDDLAEIRRALARIEEQLQAGRDAEASGERAKMPQQRLGRAS